MIIVLKFEPKTDISYKRKRMFQEAAKFLKPAVVSYGGHPEHMKKEKVSEMINLVAPRLIELKLKGTSAKIEFHDK